MALSQAGSVVVRRSLELSFVEWSVGVDVRIMAAAARALDVQTWGEGRHVVGVRRWQGYDDTFLPGCSECLRIF